MNRYERIQVECYSGYKTNERPQAFFYLGRRWEIEDIVDRWYEGGRDPSQPVVNYFKVRSAEGRLFILRYLSLFDSWSMMTAG